MSDIVKKLIEANYKGVSPPQDWTSRCIDEITELRTKLAHLELAFNDRVKVIEMQLNDKAQLELALKVKDEFIEPLTHVAGKEVNGNKLHRLAIEALAIQPSPLLLNDYRNSVIEEYAEIADKTEYENNRFDFAGSGDEIRKLKV